MTGVNLDPTLSIDFKYDWGQFWTPLCPLTLCMIGVNLNPTLSFDVDVNLDPTLSIDFKYDWCQFGPKSVY